MSWSLPSDRIPRRNGSILSLFSTRSEDPPYARSILAVVNLVRVERLDERKESYRRKRSKAIDRHKGRRYRVDI